MPNPYISYKDLASWLLLMYNQSLRAVNDYFLAHTSGRSAVDFKSFCDSSSKYTSTLIIMVQHIL